MIIGQHTIARSQAHAYQSEERSGVTKHELSGSTPAQVGRQRVGHPAQQVVDERPSGEVPSVLPAVGARGTATADGRWIQRLGVDASRCRSGAHQQPDIIGTAEAQQRRTISVKHAHRKSHGHSGYRTRRAEPKNCRRKTFATHNNNI